MSENVRDCENMFAEVQQQQRSVDVNRTEKKLSGEMMIKNKCHHQLIGGHRKAE